MGDSNLFVNWMNGRWEINNQNFQSGSAKDSESVGTIDIRPMADHLDLLQHFHRDWNEEADRLTHEARDKGASWNSFTMTEGSKVEAVRACSDGGVSKQEDRKVKHKKRDRLMSSKHQKELKKLLRRWNGQQQSKLRKSSLMMPR